LLLLLLLLLLRWRQWRQWRQRRNVFALNYRIIETKGLECQQARLIPGIHINLTRTKTLKQPQQDRQL